MDQITFHYDTVLSEVHMLLPSGRHLMTRLNRVGQPVFMSKFKILVERHNNDQGKDILKEEKDKDPGGASGNSKTDTHGENEEKDCDENVVPFLDEDGDLDIVHRPRKNPLEANGRDLVCPVILKQSNLEQVLEQGEDNTDEEEGLCFKDVIRIEHTMATPLEDVGKQVWRGAFFLADFILSESVMFRGATVLELGAGTGLTSIIMATTAKTVYCTDVGDDLLGMCKRNVTLNKREMEPAGILMDRDSSLRQFSINHFPIQYQSKWLVEHSGSHDSVFIGGEVRVRKLDWLQHGLCTDADMEFSWTEEEVADLYNNTSFIIAADVCYDDDLTDGLFRTLYQLCSNFNHTCTIFISIEKRMNFTLRHMDVSCEAYRHFRHCLSQLKDLVDGRCRFKVEQLPSNFAQFLLYERIEQLELWKVTVTPPSFKQAWSDSELLSS